MAKGFRIPRIGGLSGDIRLALRSWPSLLDQLNSAVDITDKSTRPGSLQDTLPGPCRYRIGLRRDETRGGCCTACEYQGLLALIVIAVVFQTGEQRSIR